MCSNDWSRRYFQAAGSHATEAQAVSEHLVEANLVGHDSHGVIRVAPYIAWLRDGKLVANQSPRTVLAAGSIGVLDGQLGYGQVMARHATDLAIKLVREHGIAAVALFELGPRRPRRGSGPRWRPRRASFRCASSTPRAAASWSHRPAASIAGCRQIRSLSAVPVRGAKPLLVDMSTCAIAEGKIRVAFNKGQLVPDNAIIDSKASRRMTRGCFYADPPVRSCQSADIRALAWA